MAEIAEDCLVEQLVAHATVERLANPVLRRLAGSDETPGDPAAVGPGEDGGRCELGPVIGGDQVELAAPGDDGVEFARCRREGRR